MIFWFFGILAVVAAAFAVAYKDFIRVVLALWLSGLAVGCAFLSYGAETLAVFQWISVTLVSIALLVFSLLFGEAGGQERTKRSFTVAMKEVLASGTFLPAAACLIAGLGFAIVLIASAPTEALHTGQSGGEALKAVDLSAVGGAIADRNMISFEVMAFALLVTVVGGGTIARPDPQDRASPDEGHPESESGRW